MDNKSQKQQVIVAVIMLLIGFLIGVLITAGWYQGNDEMDGTSATSTQAQQDDGDVAGDATDNNDNDIADRSVQDTDTAGQSGSNSVSVSNQVAGEEVTVASVVTDTVTWVAVREGEDGGMGNILGARRVEAGAHQDVTVRLLRATTPGQEYFVTLYADNGDLEFSHISDTIIQSGGQTVFSRFSTNE